jgi:hypothetical protein
MAIDPFGNTIDEDEQLRKILRDTRAFGETSTAESTLPFSPIGDEGLRNAYKFGMIPTQTATGGANDSQQNAGTSVPQDTGVDEPKTPVFDSTPTLEEMTMAPGAMQADIFNPYSEIVRNATGDRDYIMQDQLINNQVLNPTGTVNFPAAVLRGVGQTVQDLTGQGDRTPMEVAKEATSVRGLPLVGGGVQYTPDATRFFDTAGASAPAQSVGPRMDNEGTILLDPAIKRDTPDAMSPQDNFENRIKSGPLSDFETEQAKIYAASMGTTFDPEKGYGAIGSAPVMDRGVAATQQAILRESSLGGRTGAPTISQIQELDRMDRERMRGPDQPLDEREQRLVRQQMLRDNFGGNVPSGMIDQRGQIQLPSAQNIPSEITGILSKQSSMRTQDEVDRLARFARSSIGQALGGLPGLDTAMLTPEQREANLAKLTQAELTTRTKEVQLAAAQADLKNLLNSEQDPVKASQINASLESLGVDRIGEGGLTIDSKGNLRTPTQKLKPGSAEYNRAVNLLNQTAGGRAILSSLGLNTFPGYSVDKPL